MGCAVIEDECEGLPINLGICGAQPWEFENEGGSSMEFGDQESEDLLMARSEDYGHLYEVSNVTS